MTDPTYTYRPSAAALAERIVELATDAPAVNRAVRELLDAWDDLGTTFVRPDADARFLAAMNALREVTR